jgi:acylpyruvate hydrolase
MRLLTVKISDRFELGAVVDDDVVVFSKCAPRLPEVGQLPKSMRALFWSEDGIDRARKILDNTRSGSSMLDDLKEIEAVVPFDKAVLMPPVTDPGLILSCGINYRQHIHEMNTWTPPDPVCHIKALTSMTGSGSPIALPEDYPDMVDFEGELCAVIGRPCHKVERSEALQYVAGYTMANDVSARDWLVPQTLPNGVEVTKEAAVFRNVLGKQYPTFCPVGPAIVTTDEIPDPNDLHYETLLNGKVMQSTDTSDMLFDVASIISYYSKFYQFLPGDVITTGTPSGVGFGRTPKVFMRPGDVVEVRAASIGTLLNPVIASSDYVPTYHARS